VASAKPPSAPDQNPAALAAYVAFAVVAAILVYSFVSVAREGEVRRRCSPTCLLHPAYTGADRIAPSFELSDMNGKKVSLADYRGRVVVLNFWTKTCGPCLEEMPDLVELTKILATRSDVSVVTVSTDEGPDDIKDTLKSVLHEERTPFPVLFDPESKIVNGKFGTHLFPETWIIDKRGVIRARFDGARDWTNPAVVELIDQIRAGGWCPIDIKEGHISGPAAPVCEEIGGT
jgi:peroxiredoxin